MQDLNDLYYFSIVVEKGGFAAAGRALDIPKSRLSRRIAQLEDRLGVRLLQRSTRRFAVTDAGQRFYRHCQTVIAEAQAAEEAVAELTSEPRGLVRVSCPVSITQNVMTEMVPEFCEKYPQVRIMLISTNRRIDLINEGVDVAIRVRFKLDTDADLVLRTFGRSSALIVASPAYLSRHGRPSHPSELSRYTTISISELESQVWELSGADGTTHRFEHQPRLMCGDFPLVLAAATRGLGIALLRRVSVRARSLQASSKCCCPNGARPKGLFSRLPSHRGLLPAVRALIDWLAVKMPIAAENNVPGI